MAGPAPGGVRRPLPREAGGEGARLGRALGPRLAPVARVPDLADGRACADRPAQQELVYVLANGLHQTLGYRVGADGDLTQVASVPVPAGAIGLDAG
jgi:hypothetical protein